MFLCNIKRKLIDLLLSMIYYNITDIKTFKNIVKDFYKTKNIDKTITKLLYNYQQRLVKNSV